jgi:hypothetical protein
MEAWLKGMQLQLQNLEVPERYQFRVAYTCCLDTSARTAVFPDLRNVSDLATAADGVKSFKNFSKGVLASHLAAAR